MILSELYRAKNEYHRVLFHKPEAFVVHPKTLREIEIEIAQSRAHYGQSHGKREVLVIDGMVANVDHNVPEWEVWIGRKVDFLLVEERWNLHGNQKGIIPISVGPQVGHVDAMFDPDKKQSFKQVEVKAGQRVYETAASGLKKYRIRGAEQGYAERKYNAEEERLRRQAAEAKKREERHRRVKKQEGDIMSSIDRINSILEKQRGISHLLDQIE